MDIELNAAQAELDHADDAIRRARNDECTFEELVEVLLASKVAVPVAGPPGETWFPAVVTTSDKALLVAAFTQTDLASVYCAVNREYPRAMLLPLRWVIEHTPSTHGIVFNVGSDNVFEWEADRINGVRDELLAK